MLQPKHQAVYPKEPVKIRLDVTVCLLFML